MKSRWRHFEINMTSYLLGLDIFDVNFPMVLQTEILSTVASVFFFKHMISLKSFNSLSKPEKGIL